MDVESSLKIANLSLLAVTLLGVLISGMVYFLSQASEKAKDREMAAYKVEAQKLISQANQRAEEARQKAAEAALQLDRERAEREKMREQLGPRKLSHDTKVSIAQKIALVPPLRVELVFSPDPEVQGYALDILQLLKAAGAEVKAKQVRTISTGPEYPLEISTRGAPDRGPLLAEAFSDAGVAFNPKSHEGVEQEEDGLRFADDVTCDVIIRVNAKNPHLS